MRSERNPTSAAGAMHGRRSAQYFCIALTLAAALSACATMRNDPPPPGATALCRDGTLSYAPRSSTVCAGHDGVARWLEPGHERGDRER